MRLVKFYEGTHAGMLHQSIRPRLFRVQYKQRSAGRMYERDVIRSGHDEHDVRARLQFADPHGDIRGEIVVTHVLDLAPVYA